MDIILDDINPISPSWELEFDIAPPWELNSEDILGTLPVTDLDVGELTREALDAQNPESEMHGRPWYDLRFWDHQMLSFNCGVVVQKMILNAYGIPLTEGELTEIAIDRGWLTEGGMSPADVGKLLEHFGIETHAVVGATVDDLIAELQQGHCVIVAVRGNDLFFPDDPIEEVLDEFDGDAADHVVWVTGIDNSDPDNPIIYVNDSGNPDGAGRAYTLDEFVDGWEDSRFSYIATDTPRPLPVDVPDVS